MESRPNIAGIPCVITHDEMDRTELEMFVKSNEVDILLL